MEPPLIPTTRHQWGPAPSGSAQHLSVCRRCGLNEVTDWYDAPGGLVEVTTWVTPTGAVVGARRVDSRQGPPRHRPLEMLDAVGEPPAAGVVAHCPGDPGAWSGRNERLDP